MLSLHVLLDLFSIRDTLELLSKKQVIFGQGLDFLNFSQGNRSENEQNRRKHYEHPRKFEENRRKTE